MALRNPFRSLPGRIVCTVFAATLITSLTVTAVSVSTIGSFLREKINQKFPRVLDATSTKLDRWYEDRLREIDVFSNSDVLETNLAVLSPDAPTRRRERARAEIEQYIAYVLDGFPQYAAIFVLDEKHEILLWVGESLDISDEAKRELGSVDEHQLGDVIQHSPRALQLTSAPVHGVDKKLGTLHALLRVDGLKSSLPTQELGVSGRIFLIDSAGHYIVGSTSLPSTKRFSGPLLAAGADSMLADYKDEAGERIVGGAKRFSRFGWTIVVEQAYSQAFEPVVSAIASVLVINLAIVLVMGLVAFRIAFSIVRPIDALSAAARRITDGEREIEIPETNSKDEVGVLTRAFSAMTMRLTSNAAELEASNNAVAEANERLKIQNEELQRVNEVLEQLSITDGLTKLHNHRYFQEVLVQETKRAGRSKRPLSLILIDIDYFKRWNDRLGHAGGDEILRRLAEVMTGLIRDTDLLARYGGEEFALLAPSTDLVGATRLAEKIRAETSAMQLFISPPSELHSLTVSIGVASYHGDKRQLFNDADRALYRAKAAGRDCVVGADESEDEEID